MIQLSKVLSMIVQRVLKCLPGEGPANAAANGNHEPVVMVTSDVVNDRERYLKRTRKGSGKYEQAKHSSPHEARTTPRGTATARRRAAAFRSNEAYYDHQHHRGRRASCCCPCLFRDCAGPHTCQRCVPGGS